MKVKELIKKLQADGWYLVRQKGSHQHFKHPKKKNLVTVPNHGKGNEDLAPGTLNKILKDAGLK